METYFPHLTSPAASSKKAKQTYRYLSLFVSLVTIGLIAWLAGAS